MQAIRALNPVRSKPLAFSHPLHVQGVRRQREDGASQLGRHVQTLEQRVHVASRAPASKGVRAGKACRRGSANERRWDGRASPRPHGPGCDAERALTGCQGPRIWMRPSRQAERKCPAESARAEIAGRLETKIPRSQGPRRAAPVSRRMLNVHRSGARPAGGLGATDNRGRAYLCCRGGDSSAGPVRWCLVAVGVPGEHVPKRAHGRIRVAHCRCSCGQVGPRRRSASPCDLRCRALSSAAGHGRTRHAKGPGPSETAARLKGALGVCCWVLPGSHSFDALPPPDNTRPRRAVSAKHTDESALCVSSTAERVRAFGADCALPRLRPD